MKKLALNLEVLRVESFHTSPAGRGLRGTVRGHSEWKEIGEQTRIPTGPLECPAPGGDSRFCPPEQTEDCTKYDSCGGTCALICIPF